MSRKRGCGGCEDKILRAYFEERDTDGDGVIVDWGLLLKEVRKGRSLSEAIIESAEYVAGSWLCKYLTFQKIIEEMDKGKSLDRIIREMKRKEPLRYRGCIKGEGLIYEVEEGR